jgi:basic membrane protein A
MKKVLAILLTMVLTLGFGLTALAESGAAEIAMITDIGTIDDKSFNQGTWEGVKAYADANGKTCNYYKPAEATTNAYLDEIDKAVAAGAKVIVTPGYMFEVPIFTAQDKYPDVHFILIDGYPNNGDSAALEARTNENVVGIKFAEEQAGFLAGYAVVKDGNTKLGFLGGMAVPAVVRFGYGFVQGAEAAAKELGIADITMMYHYTGGFAATPEAQTLAASWYSSGVTAIFGCGGAVGNSAMAAAEAIENGKVIGVDVDQSNLSKTVITSAMKDLNSTVQQMLTAYYTDKFPGGQSLTLGAADKAIGLPMATSKFEKFTQADYDALFGKLAAGEIEIIKDTKADAAGTIQPVALTDLGTTIVKITEVK